MKLIDLIRTTTGGPAPQTSPPAYALAQTSSPPGSVPASFSARLPTRSADTMLNVTPESVKIALETVACGPHGTCSTICDGVTLTLYWARGCHRLLLRVPGDRTAEWTVHNTSLYTKGRSRWDANNTYRLTPGAAEFIAPRMAAHIARITEN